MDITELETLKKYGTEFQNKCITCLVTDRLFLERIFDILSPDYFETSAQKWIVEQSREYFLKYRDIPTPMVLSLKLKEIDDQMKLLKQGVGDLLSVVFDHMTDIDLPYIKEQFLEFCKARALAKAILTSVDLLNKGDYDGIKTTVDGALRAGMERDLGHQYNLDVDKRMSVMARDCIKTGWDDIDQLMDGGLGKGELGFIVAPSGAGKTWILSRLGAEGLKQGKNVLHVTLELNENYVGLRYDSYFTGIGFQDIRKNTDRVKSIIDTITGKLFIKYFPLRTVSAISIKLFVERLQMLNQIKVDMLIIDYADILRPVILDKTANKYNEAGSVYEELRAIAGELQIPIWSASQANREGHDADIVTAGNIADSYRKIMTGDFIMSLSRKNEDKEEDTGRLLVVKNRFGPDGITFPCRFSASCGHVHLFDKSSSEGKELLTKMDKAKKDTESHKKKMTKGMWDKFMKNLDEDDDSNLD